MARGDCWDAFDLAPRVAKQLGHAVETGTCFGLRSAIADVLDTCIGSDEVLLTQVDLSHAGGTVVAAGCDVRVDDALTEELARTGPSHPVVRSYLLAGDDGTPRRASQVSEDRAWNRHLLASPAFVQHGGRHQLSIVATLTPPVGRGWVLLREHEDFSDRDVAIAHQLLPVLTVIDRMCGPIRVDTPCLTARQLQVMHLLAQGMTARRIAGQMGISERTVNKHLEGIYRRLHVADRVEALLTARHQGLIPG